MTKYHGIDRAEETYLSENNYITSRKGRKEKKSGKGRRFAFLWRLLASALIFLTVFGLSKLEVPVVEKIVYYVKYAICYDLDGRDDKTLGELRPVTLLEQEQERRGSD